MASYSPLTDCANSRGLFDAQVLERALRTGSALLAAAQADALWSIGCGDAIEDAKQAINRYTCNGPWPLSRDSVW